MTRSPFQKKRIHGCRSSFGDGGAVFALPDLRDAARADQTVGAIKMKVNNVIVQPALEHRLGKADLLV
jgi:hypothetical protein